MMELTEAIRKAEEYVAKAPAGNAARLWDRDYCALDGLMRDLCSLPDGQVPGVIAAVGKAKRFYEGWLTARLHLRQVLWAARVALLRTKFRLSPPDDWSNKGWTASWRK